MSAALPDARSLRRRFLLLVALRWLPTGLTMPVTVLLASARGLSLAEIGLVLSVQGFVVLALELPTGGLADSLGRRPTLVLAGAVGLASLALLLVADSVATYVGVMALQGVWRALDSGPLEAWYVDAALAVDPGARLEEGLSAASAVLSAALCAGALVSGALVALEPLSGADPLVVPVLAALVLSAVSTGAVLALVTEARPARGAGAAWTAVRGVPAVVAAGVRLVRGDRVLVALVAVELFWGFGMVAFEVLMPVRLAEVSGSGAPATERAAALMGPVTAGAWAASAAGAALVPLLSRRTGVWVAAAALRVAQGLAVAGMGLLAGPLGVVAAFWACYAVHGASNPLHSSLLHARASGENRAVVLSVNSMVAQPAGSVGSITLGALAAATSTSTAMLVAALALALAAPLYRAARPGSGGGSRGGMRRWPRAARSASTEPFPGTQGEHGRGLRT